MLDPSSDDNGARLLLLVSAAARAHVRSVLLKFTQSAHLTAEDKRAQFQKLLAQACQAEGGREPLSRNERNPQPPEPRMLNTRGVSSFNDLKKYK